MLRLLRVSHVSLSPLVLAPRALPALSSSLHHQPWCAFSSPATVTPAMVRELREATGAPMSECKAILTQALANLNGKKLDMADLIDALRKKGISLAAKKANRTAAEGLVAVGLRQVADAADAQERAASEAVVVELNSETDFVARNETFQRLLQGVASAALGVSGQQAKDAATPTGPLREIDLQAINDAPCPDGKTAGPRKVTDAIAEAVTAIRENLRVRRAVHLQCSPNGVISAYVHSAVDQLHNGIQMGRIGTLVHLEPAAPLSPAERTKLKEFGVKLAMHIAAAKPLYLRQDTVPAADLERERAIQQSLAKDSGKEGAMLDKVVAGRMKKFYEQHVLLEQPFMLPEEGEASMNVEKTVKARVGNVTIKAFARFQVGEGVQHVAEPTA